MIDDTRTKAVQRKEEKEDEEEVKYQTKEDAYDALFRSLEFVEPERPKTGL